MTRLRPLGACGSATIPGPPPSGPRFGSSQPAAEIWWEAQGDDSADGGFLLSFIGYGQDQITNLDIEWDTNSEGLNTEAVAGLPVLVYQAPDGDMKLKPMTEDACHPRASAV